MGGDKTQGQGYSPRMQDLVYRTEGPQHEDRPVASDQYSQDYFDNRDYQARKKTDELMSALGRLGFVPEAWPRSMPQIPYRDQPMNIGF